LFTLRNECRVASTRPKHVARLLQWGHFPLAVYPPPVT
jgi:hypothetical protein